LSVCGIPSGITLQFAEDWVRPRISSKRFQHVLGVVAVAEEIAEEYRCDVFQAGLAALLHDCCKEIKDKELVQMALEFGLTVDDHQRARGHLLHGPVAAATVRRDLGITNDDVLSAIAEHTLGKVPMCPLSEVVYLADCLEESRPDEFKSPIRAALHSGGRLNVRAALIVAMDLCIQQLLESGKPIHPLTVEVRNHYLKLGGG
jgi:predicted HD superfamily hydrolase involved in NAD metabolism